MKNSTKIIIGVIILILLVLIWNLISRSNSSNQEVEEVEVDATQEISMEIIDNTVYLKDSAGITQDILSISNEFGTILESNNIAVPQEMIDSKKFITDYDVNFDGINDVAVLDGINYGGAVFIYNYFLVNPDTLKFEDYKELPHVSNFIFDEANGKITSVYRSGPEWIQDEYLFTRDGYLETLNVVE